MCLRIFFNQEHVSLDEAMEPYYGPHNETMYTRKAYKVWAQILGHVVELETQELVLHWEQVLPKVYFWALYLQNLLHS